MTVSAIAICSTLGLTAFDVISVVIIFFMGELFLSRLLFKWNIESGIAPVDVELGKEALPALSR